MKFIIKIIEKYAKNPQLWFIVWSMVNSTKFIIYYNYIFFHSSLYIILYIVSFLDIISLIIAHTVIFINYHTLMYFSFYYCILFLFIIICDYYSSLCVSTFKLKLFSILFHYYSQHKKLTNRILNILLFVSFQWGKKSSLFLFYFFTFLKKYCGKGE